MKKKCMLQIMLVLSLIMYIGISPLHYVSAQETTAPSWVTSVDYVALGDSLAEGMDHQGKIGDGYTDYLANKLSEVGLLSSFTKQFAVSGYTTVDVLNDIKQNVAKETAEGKTVRMQEAIKEAEIITITAGANDVLSHVEVDALKRTLKFNETAIQKEIEQVGRNLSEIISVIHSINPKAQVYIMGYYNPFPHLSKDIQPLLSQLLDGLNKAISMTAQMPNVFFVETADAIAKDYKNYLPNPANIHLSPAGYEVTAKLFWDKVVETFPIVPVDGITIQPISKNALMLSWIPVSHDGTTVTYDVYRDDVKVTSLPMDTLSYTFSDLNANQTYSFSVKAVDEHGNESDPYLSISYQIAEDTPLFTDINGHWAEAYIKQAIENGIFNGYTDGTFKPDNNLTRAQAASVIVRALQLKNRSTEDNAFLDISGYAPATQADIMAAYSNGLVRGQNGYFKPTNNVTRAQLALIAWRVLEQGVDTKDFSSSLKHPFTDLGNFDNETIYAISALADLGIITKDEATFRPNDAATRADTAAIISLLIDYLQQ